jgi:hypothetical protein
MANALNNTWNNSPRSISIGTPLTSSLLTPFGYYDLDQQFSYDAPKFASYCAQVLGYPNIDVELLDTHFYTAYEEAVLQYSALVNANSIVNNLLMLQGKELTGSYINGQYVQGENISQKFINDNLARHLEIARSYGTETGIGGTVDIKKGTLHISSSKQDYNLYTDFILPVEGGKPIEIMKIFHYAPPAVMRFYDPRYGTGIGLTNMLNEFGWDRMSPAVQFMVMPIYEDALRIQAIKFNDELRRAAYSFETHGNILRLHPVPQWDFDLFFDYIIKSDKYNPLGLPSTSSLTISDVSNIPYGNMEYHYINQPGKNWIRRWAVALSKDILGSIRGKYTEVPIPNDKVTLDGSTLRAQAVEEKSNLLTELKELFEKTNNTALMQAKKEQSEYLNYTLAQIPMPFYIG